MKCTSRYRVNKRTSKSLFWDLCNACLPYNLVQSSGFCWFLIHHHFECKHMKNQSHLLTRESRCFCVMLTWFIKLFVSLRWINKNSRNIGCNKQNVILETWKWEAVCAVTNSSLWLFSHRANKWWQLSEVVGREAGEPGGACTECNMISR